MVPEPSRGQKISGDGTRAWGQWHGGEVGRQKTPVGQLGGKKFGRKKTEAPFVKDVVLWVNMTSFFFVLGTVIWRDSWLLFDRSEHFWEMVEPILKGGQNRKHFLEYWEQLPEPQNMYLFNIITYHFCIKWMDDSCLSSPFTSKNLSFLVEMVILKTPKLCHYTVGGESFPWCPADVPAGNSSWTSATCGWHPDGQKALSLLESVGITIGNGGNQDFW